MIYTKKSPTLASAGTLFRALTIAIAILFTSSITAMASLNLHLSTKGCGQVALNLSSGSLYDDVDTITTTGSSPYFQTRGLSRDLADDEVYLSFDYICTTDLQSLKLTFAPPQVAIIQ